MKTKTQTKRFGNATDFYILTEQICDIKRQKKMFIYMLNVQCRQSCKDSSSLLLYPESGQTNDTNHTQATQ